MTRSKIPVVAEFGTFQKLSLEIYCIASVYRYSTVVAGQRMFWAGKFQWQESISNHRWLLQHSLREVQSPWSPFFFHPAIPYTGCMCRYSPKFTADRRQPAIAPYAYRNHVYAHWRQPYNVAEIWNSTPFLVTQAIIRELTGDRFCAWWRPPIFESISYDSDIRQLSP